MKTHALIPNIERAIAHAEMMKNNLYVEQGLHLLSGGYVDMRTTLIDVEENELYFEIEYGLRGNYVMFEKVHLDMATLDAL